MMKGYFRGVITGLLCAGIILGTCEVYAQGGIQQTVEVIFNKVNVAINGQVVGKQGSNYILDSGEEVPYSLVYKGTTYLPLRKVADLLDMEVTWDGKTNTAGINQHLEAEQDGADKSDTKSEDAVAEPSAYNFLKIDNKLYNIVYSYDGKDQRKIDSSKIKVFDKELYMLMNKERYFMENMLMLGILVDTFKTTSSENPYFNKSIDMYSTYYNKSLPIKHEVNKKYNSAKDIAYSYSITYRGKSFVTPSSIVGLDTEIDGVRVNSDGNYVYANINDLCKYLGIHARVSYEYSDELDDVILIIEHQ